MLTAGLSTQPLTLTSDPHMKGYKSKEGGVFFLTLRSAGGNNVFAPPTETDPLGTDHLRTLSSCCSELLSLTFTSFLSQNQEEQKLQVQAGPPQGRVSHSPLHPGRLVFSLLLWTLANRYVSLQHLLNVKSLKYLSNLTLPDRITKSLLHLHKKKKPPSISAQFQVSHGGGERGAGGLGG